MPDQRPDDDLADDVRHALEHADPVPRSIHEAALAAFAFRDLDGVLAELMSDSSAGVRDSADGPMVFSVEHAEVAITVEDGRLLGQVAPPVACTGTVGLANAEPLTIRTDELGRFAVEISPGPVRIVLDHPDGRIRTDWFSA